MPRLRRPVCAGQNQSPSGGVSIGGSRQCMWYDRSHLSHSIRSPPVPQRKQKSSLVSMGCSARAPQSALRAGREARKIARAAGVARTGLRRLLAALALLLAAVLALPRVLLHRDLRKVGVAAEAAVVDQTLAGLQRDELVA